jgi:hypothetical protein
MAILPGDIMKQLECPVCLFHPVPPIAQCNNGHCICKSRESTADWCPICRASFIFIWNLVLKVMRGLKYACRNKAQSCPALLSLDTITEHDAVCPLGKHEYPASKTLGGSCTWKGHWDDFGKQIPCVHKIEVKESPCESSSANNSWALISTQRRHFLFDKRSTNMWHSAVLLIGTRAEEYTYLCMLVVYGASSRSCVKFIHSQKFQSQH